MNERMLMPESFMFLSPFMDQYYELKDKMEERKVHIKKEWQETYNMPRKQKKQKRKELELGWRIANWDIGV